MQKAKDYCWKLLPELLEMEGVAGNCSKSLKLVEEYVSHLGVDYHVTNKGGLIAIVKGKYSSQSRVITAHVDTLGAMVKFINSQGQIFLTNIGGASPISIEGEYVTLETTEGKRYRGTVLHTNPSAHVNKDLSTEKRTFDNLFVRIDEKVHSEKDVLNLGIKVGDFCFFDTRVEVSESGFIKSRHLDDKAGVAALLGSLEYMQREKMIPEYDTYFYFSVAEEVGNGAVSALPQNCFELVAVDMGALGMKQTSDEYTVSICAKDSSGPFDFQLRKKIVRIAQEYNIPYKVDIYPFYGSDAAAALRTGLDARHILFGPGIDASHSYERVHRESLDATTELLIRYLAVQ